MTCNVSYILLYCLIFPRYGLNKPALGRRGQWTLYKLCWSEFIQSFIFQSTHPEAGVKYLESDRIIFTGMSFENQAQRLHPLRDKTAGIP